MAPSGLEPATFRLVVQCLNHLRHQQRAPVFALGAHVIDGTKRIQFVTWTAQLMELGTHWNSTERVVPGQFMELLCTAKPPW
jgi:hypothetical protein